MSLVPWSSPLASRQQDWGGDVWPFGGGGGLWSLPDPFTQFERDFFNNPFGGWGGGGGRGGVTSQFQPNMMRMSLREEPDNFIVEAEIPGVEKKDIQVRLLPNNVLNVSCDKPKSQSYDDQFVQREERYFGRMERSMQLPTAVRSAGEISAEYTNGVLQVTVPKALPQIQPETSGQRIDVK